MCEPKDTWRLTGTTAADLRLQSHKVVWNSPPKVPKLFILNRCHRRIYSLSISSHFGQISEHLTGPLASSQHVIEVFTGFNFHPPDPDPAWKKERKKKFMKARKKKEKEKEERIKQKEIEKKEWKKKKKKRRMKQKE